MKIHKGSIEFTASRQYMGLLVPDISIGGVADVEAPDEWFYRDRQGCLRLTRLGWEANKEKIKEAWDNSQYNRGYTWKQFVDNAERELSKLK